MENTLRKIIYRNTNQEQEEMKGAGPPHCPVVHGGLSSGPQQTQITKRSAAAPAAASDGEDEAMAEKTKRSTMAAQISTS